MRRSVLAAIAGVAALWISIFAAGPRASIPVTTAVRQCTTCHAMQPGEVRDALDRAEWLAPDLSYAGDKYRVEWLRTWLGAPVPLRAAGYRPWTVTVSTPAGDRIDASRLQAHPSLRPSDVVPIVAFLSALRRGLNPHPAAPGDAGVSGEVHFSKVLACGACHQSRPGLGGVSGPELYSAAARLQPDWLRAFIADPRYWSTATMPAAILRADQMRALADFLLAPRTSSTDPPQPDVHGTGTPPPPPRTRAERLYRVYCSQCHGLNGDGRGINASRLFVAPRNHRSAQEMSVLTDDRLFAAIKFGGAAVGKASLMPAWSGTIADEDIARLVEYLRTLSRSGS